MAENNNTELRAKITEDALVNRKLIINSTIDESLIEIVCMQILKFNEEDSIRESMEVGFDRKENPILIFLNSHGGEVVNSLAAIGMFEMSKTPIVTIGLGHVSSAAAVILLSGHRRLCLPYTQIMIHEISGRAEGKINRLSDYLDESKNLQTLYNKIIMAKTKISKQQLDEAYTLNKDWTFGFKEAKRLGVVDDLFKF
jgi:ATP-dependent Clp protease protease subunit